MRDSVRLNKKVYLSYSCLNMMFIDYICKKIHDEGFDIITCKNCFLSENNKLSIAENIIKSTCFVLIISDEFSKYMCDEYDIALNNKKNVMVFIKSKLYRTNKEINKKFKDKMVVLWDNENELSMKIIENIAGVGYKYPERGYLFEVWVEDLFKMYGYDTSRTLYAYDSAYDIYAEKDGKKFYVEVKLSRLRVINKVVIEKTLRMYEKMSLKDNEYFIVVTANIIPDEMKKHILTKDRMFVIEISELLYLVQNIEDLKYRLLSLVEYATEDIEVTETEEIIKLFNITKEKTIDSFVDYNVELSKLLGEINKWKPEITTSEEYEKLCIKVLKVLFSKDLTLWSEQKKSNDDLYRFDLICKIKDGVTSDFWKFIEEFFRTKYIIFEFKNYKKFITQREIYTTEKYLYAKALRSVAIIISCNGSDDNAKKAIKGSLRENGKLILNLSNRNLVSMIEYELNGNLASEYLYNILDEMLIELEK